MAPSIGFLSPSNRRFWSGVGHTQHTGSLLKSLGVESSVRRPFLYFEAYYTVEADISVSEVKIVAVYPTATSDHPLYENKSGKINTTCQDTP